MFTKVKHPLYSMDKENDITCTKYQDQEHFFSGPRNCQNASIYGPKNCTISTIYGPRNCKNFEISGIWLLGPEIVKMLQSDFWAQKLRLYSRDPLWFYDTPYCLFQSFSWCIWLFYPYLWFMNIRYQTAKWILQTQAKLFSYFLPDTLPPC